MTSNFIEPSDEFWQGKEVHLYVTSTELVEDEAGGEDYTAWLDPGERDRLARFTNLGARAQYLVGRALSKSVLARYLDVEPSAVRFEKTENGKPFLRSRASRGLEFNVTHKPGVVACAVAVGVRVGVDLELFKPEKTGEEIAKRFFSENENRFLDDYEGAAYARRFFQIWTLKEATIKALGLGMKLPLKHFALIPRCEPDAAESSAIDASFDASLNENPDDWQFHLRSIGENVIVSLALKRGDRPDLAVRVEGDFRLV